MKGAETLRTGGKGHRGGAWMLLPVRVRGGGTGGEAAEHGPAEVADGAGEVWSRPPGRPYAGWRHR